MWCVCVAESLLTKGKVLEDEGRGEGEGEAEGGGARGKGKQKPLMLTGSWEETCTACPC